MGRVANITLEKAVLMGSFVVFWVFLKSYGPYKPAMGTAHSATNIHVFFSGPHQFRLVHTRELAEIITCISISPWPTWPRGLSIHFSQLVDQEKNNFLIFADIRV